jgi:transposase
MSRFTTLFERFAIDVLRECDVQGAGRLLRTTWDQTWHLMQRAVARGLELKEPVAPVHLGVDEKSAGRGQNYVTIVSDLERGSVEYVTDERRQASLDGYFERFSAEQLSGIEAVAMDMWEPFANSARAHL